MHPATQLALTALVRLLEQKGLIEHREYLRAVACAAVAAKQTGKPAAGDVLFQYVAEQG